MLSLGKEFPQQSTQVINGQRFYLTRAQPLERTYKKVFALGFFHYSTQEYKRETFQTRLTTWRTTFFEWKIVREAIWKERASVKPCSSLDVDKLLKHINLVLCDYFKFLALLFSSYLISHQHNSTRVIVDNFLTFIHEEVYVLKRSSLFTCDINYKMGWVSKALFLSLSNYKMFSFHCSETRVDDNFLSRNY